MVHGDPALHRSNRCERKEVRAITRRIHPGHIRARHPVHLNMPRRSGLHPNGFHAHVLSIRDRTHRHERMRSANFPTIACAHQYSSIIHAHHRIDPRVLHQGHPSLRQHGFQHIRSISVVVWQDSIPRSHHCDFHPELRKCRHEFRAGHAGTNHNQMLRQFSNVIDLLPGHDPLTVGLCPRQNTRRRTSRHQHQITLNGFYRAIGMLYPNIMHGLVQIIVIKSASTCDDPNPGAFDRTINIIRLFPS